jgi:hypothetical protein
MGLYRLARVWLLRLASAAWLIVGVVNAWISFALEHQPDAIFYIDQIGTATIPSVLLAATAEILASLSKTN